MYLFIASVILILIIVNPCLLLPLPKNDVLEALGLKRFPADKNSIYNNKTNPTTEVTIKRDLHKGISFDRNIKSDDDTSTSLSHRPRGIQTMEQFGQKNLWNNQHDASNLDHILWQYFNRQNFHPQFPSSTSKPSPFNPPNANHANTLLNQETAQLDPINAVNKPAAGATGTLQSLDNVFIDLLHSQPSITGGNTNNGFGSLPKIVKPHFNSYLAGFANTVKGIMTSGKNCSVLSKLLPVLIVNSFINTISTISNLQLTTSLMIPFVILSVINFITSFLFLDEYCPGSK